MDVKQVKTFRKLITSFCLFLAMRLVEELYVIPRIYNTMGLVSCIGGLLILFVYIRMDNKPLEVIGMLFSKHKFGKGLGIAAVMNIIPAAIVYGLAYVKFSGAGGNMAVYYSSTANAYSVAGTQKFLFWIGFGLVISIVHAFFYEMAFRGLLLTLAARSFRFSTVNTMQAALYTFWYIIPILRILLYNRSLYSMEQYVALFVFLIIYEMLTAVRLGMLRRATGSIWVCIFDHVAFTYIIDMLHAQPNSTSGLAFDYAKYVIMIGYQALAMVLTFIYYKKKMAKIQDAQRSEFLSAEAE